MMQRICRNWTIQFFRKIQYDFKQINITSSFMFVRDTIFCKEGNKADYFCIGQNCQQSPFVCNLQCPCRSSHQFHCKLKNIPKLTNEVQSLLKRNFSKTQKGDGIEVIGRVARQTCLAPRNTRFCLTICQALPKTTMEFKVKSLKGCVGVGILHKQTVKSNLYQFLPDANYINHGGFMLLSNGYKYSHTSVKENFQEVPRMSLQEGEKITLLYDQGKLKLRQSTREATIEIPDCMTGLWYGVYLYEEGDEVEVLVKE